MDTLPLSIQGITGSPPLPDKPSMPESLPTIGINASNPSAVVTAIGNANNDPSHKSTVNSNNSHDVAAAVIGANRFFEQANRELRFERSDTGNAVVVQVMDRKTGEVLRQFPSEQMLQISKDLEKISGLLFKDSA